MIIRCISQLFLILVDAFVTVSCKTNSYLNEEFYYGIPEWDEKLTAAYEQLAQGEEPNIITASSGDDCERILSDFQRKGYGILGFQNYNGDPGTKDQIKELAMKKRSQVAVAVHVYTDTQNYSTSLLLPNVQTTNFNFGGTYGSATTTGTSVVPINTSQRRYDNAVYLLNKIKGKLRLGIMMELLSNEERAFYQRNNGIIIRTVIDGGRAFKANLLINDVIFSVNGQQASSVEEMQELLNDPNVSELNLSILRKRGSDIIEKNILIPLQ